MADDTEGQDETGRIEATLETVQADSVITTAVTVNRDKPRQDGHTFTDDNDGLIREWDRDHNHVATRPKTQYQPFRW